MIFILLFYIYNVIYIYIFFIINIIFSTIYYLAPSSCRVTRVVLDHRDCNTT